MGRRQVDGEAGVESASLGEAAAENGRQGLVPGVTRRRRSMCVLCSLEKHEHG